MKVTLEGRHGEVEVEFACDLADTFLVAGTWDDGVEMTPDELDALLEAYAAEVGAEHAEHLVCAAEDWADLRADR